MAEKTSEHIKKPCEGCPFRKDTKTFLRADRVESILEGDLFVCHKAFYKANKRKQCAGFMILQKENSVFVRVARALNIDLELQDTESVFDSKENCIKYHSEHTNSN